VAFGDENSLNLIQDARDGEETEDNRKAMGTAATELEHRLTQIPAEGQVSWSRQEIVYWRGLADPGPLPRDRGAVYSGVAARLFKDGERFSREFLEYKIGLHDLLAFAVVGVQKETWAIETLSEFARVGDSHGSFSRWALGNIGTREALAALEGCLTPRGNESINRNIITILQSHGDIKSADVLKEMSSNEGFSKLNRARMEAAQRYIRTRLSGRVRMAN